MDFDFEARPDCICGTSLDNADVVVKKCFAPGQVSFRRCPACGSFIQSPSLSRIALVAWYDSPDYQGGNGVRGVGYVDYMRGEPQRRIEAARRYRRDLAPCLGAGARVLEVGAATGTLVVELRSHGHDASGCDLSQRFAAQARARYALDIAIADWLDLDVADASLDAIVLLGTISNLHDLARCLRRARRQLRAGGFLFFNFPAADALVARLYGRRMWMFTPSVMQFATRRGVHAALARAGLRIESMAIDRQSPTLAKILGHARLGRVYPWLERAGLADAALPFALPLPGIVAVRARCVDDYS